MKTIKQLIQDHHRDIWSVNPDDSVQSAVSQLAEKNIGVLLVLENGKLAGILSERDCARKVLLSDKSAHDTQVREIMSARVICGRPENTIDECMALMTEKDIRHLPIMDGGQLVCLVSLGELVRSIIDEQQTVIDHLEHYIAG
ncbi:MAG: CBS domain-containing protein [Pseudomonadota bacterium]